MSAIADPRLSLEEYKQASRDELELVIERFALIEQAANLQAGSLVEGMLACLAQESADEVIAYIEQGYELKEVPDDWRERIERIIPE